MGLIRLSTVATFLGSLCIHAQAVNLHAGQESQPRASASPTGTRSPSDEMKTAQTDSEEFVPTPGAVFQPATPPRSVSKQPVTPVKVPQRVPTEPVTRGTIGRSVVSFFHEAEGNFVKVTDASQGRTLWQQAVGSMIRNIGQAAPSDSHQLPSHIIAIDWANVMRTPLIRPKRLYPLDVPAKCWHSWSAQEMAFHLCKNLEHHFNCHRGQNVRIIGSPVDSPGTSLPSPRRNGVVEEISHSQMKTITIEVPAVANDSSRSIELQNVRCYGDKDGNCTEHPDHPGKGYVVWFNSVLYKTVLLQGGRLQPIKTLREVFPLVGVSVTECQDREEWPCNMPEITMDPWLKKQNGENEAIIMIQGLRDSVQTAQPAPGKFSLQATSANPQPDIPFDVGPHSATFHTDLYKVVFSGRQDAQSFDQQRFQRRFDRFGQHYSVQDKTYFGRLYTAQISALIFDNDSINGLPYPEAQQWGVSEYLRYKINGEFYPRKSISCQLFGLASFVDETFARKTIFND